MQQFSEENICARCSKISRTCCRIQPENAVNCFPLSGAEIKDLNRYLTGEDPVLRTKNSVEFVRNLKKLIPDKKEAIDREFPQNGTHQRLRTTEDGSCILLGDKGCTLPWRVRPIFCRLYPFWVYKGKVTLFDDPECLALQVENQPRRALSLLGSTGREILDLYFEMLKHLNLK
jgi:Fe-S-cluster containining protein